MSVDITLKFGICLEKIIVLSVGRERDLYLTLITFIVYEYLEIKETS